MQAQNSDPGVGRLKQQVRWRTAIVTTAVAIGAMIVSALGAPAAMAGSGDFCGPGHLLKPGGECIHQYGNPYKEVETWNTNGEGVGSCAAVGSSDGIEWYGDHCVGDISSGYDESYCTASCNGEYGYGIVEDNSSYTAYFTGWGDWS